MLFFSMAWRNVWRNRRRSLLTVGAIALGLAFNIFMRGIGDGFHDQMVDNSVRAEIGHIQIHRFGYRDDPGLNQTLPAPQRVAQAIRSLPHVRGYTFRVLGGGLASTTENSSGVQILGVDPAQEQTVTTIQNAIVQGRYLDSGMQRPILLGERLAAHLKTSLDDKVVLLVQAADGSMGAELFRVAGIFRSGAPEMDAGVVFILRSDAQTLFALGDRITEAALLLDSSRQVPAALDALSKGLTGEPVEILPWWRVEPFLQQFIQIDDAFFYVIVLIFFVVISIGILNTIMMSVFERVREFGVMMALGTRPRQIIKLVVEEALALGLVGIVAGSLIGSALTQYFARHGINLSSFSAGAAALGITSSRVYSELTLGNLVYSNLAVLAVVMLVALYPAVHAAGLRPVEAIRHV
ncbi:MAG TPA: ABC transporter permease [Candidatus Polarisedimenticolia bacterium]|nr:ABC transporter permease [Candidatus Polarisedimenticolia bacterium]